MTTMELWPDLLFNNLSVVRYQDLFKGNTTGSINLTSHFLWQSITDSFQKSFRYFCHWTVQKHIDKKTWRRLQYNRFAYAVLQSTAVKLFTVLKLASIWTSVPNKDILKRDIWEIMTKVAWGQRDTISIRQPMLPVTSCWNAYHTWISTHRHEYCKRKNCYWAPECSISPLIAITHIMPERWNSRYW